MGFRFIDHTADVAFEVWGETISELIESASHAFYEAFVEVDKLGTDTSRSVEVEAEDVDMLLYKWLNELLYLFDTEFFAAKEVKVTADENRARGVLIGSRFTPEMVKVEPKAITMHKFRVEKRDKYYAYVVVDI
ncbi:MAG: archease [Archaeoglobaceae archaeon]